jgi:fimbrial chaperone protein
MRALRQIACVLALLVAGAGMANAGSFQINPVRATLSNHQTVSALTIHNTGSESSVMQVEIVAWSQQNGQDVYTPSRELIVTPPIFTVSAGGSQVLRVGLRRPAEGQRELTYRVFIQEVPPPPKPSFKGLQVALRFGIPVFVAPATEQSPALVWGVYRTPEGQLVVSLANNGNTHVQVANFRLVSSNEELVTQHIAAYVLSGQSSSWQVKEIPAPTAGTQLHLLAQTDAGEIDGGFITLEQK